MKENNSITAEELIKDLQEVFDGNGVPNLNYVKAKLNEYKANTVTLEQLEEEKRKAVLEALEREVPKAFKKGQVDMGELEFDILRDKESIEYYETEVKPNYE